MERMNTRRAITCVVLTALVAAGCVRKPVTAPPARRHAGPGLRAALGDVRTLGAGDDRTGRRPGSPLYREVRGLLQPRADTPRRYDAPDATVPRANRDVWVTRPLDSRGGDCDVRTRGVAG